MVERLIVDDLLAWVIDYKVISSILPLLRLCQIIFLVVIAPKLNVSFWKA